MPTYEYRCQHCHKSLEAFQRMSDAPLVKCPHCGEDTLQRIVSGGAGVIYKGEGWYVTDYSKTSSGGKDKGDSTVTAGSTSGTSAKGSETSSLPKDAPATPSTPTQSTPAAPKADS